MNDRVIFNGTPGEVWVNNGEKVRYQLIAALDNTCGVCLQYHMAIGPWWPIPIHRNCRCRQVVIKPGGSAQPFEDFRVILEGMTHDQQVAAIGASNYKLLQAGVIQWDDVVTPSRVRDFREVVARKRLSVARLEAAGVKPHHAREAYASVNTPEHELVRQVRAKLLKEIREAGLSDKQITQLAAEGLAMRAQLQREGVIQSIPAKGPINLPPDLISAFARFGSKQAEKGKPISGDALIRLSTDTLDRMGVPYRIGTLEDVNRLVPGRMIGEETPAFFDDRSRIVYILKDNEYWTNPAKVIAKFRAQKWLSTYEPQHIAIHEGVHSRHFAALESALGSEESAREAYRGLAKGTIADMETRDKIRKVVGRYAAIDPAEFVAEVGAAVIQGKTYPDWVMSLYREFKGPDF